MKNVFKLCFLALSVYGQLASAFTVFRPDGFVEVQPTSNGFDVVDMVHHNITSVTKSPNGYVIFPQDGAPTFIDMEPGESLMPPDMFLPILVDDDLL